MKIHRHPNQDLTVPPSALGLVFGCENCGCRFEHEAGDKQPRVTDDQYRVISGSRTMLKAAHFMAICPECGAYVWMRIPRRESWNSTRNRSSD